MAIKTDNDIRFWKKVVKSPNCWEWAGAKTSRGYGSFRWRDEAGRWHKYGAHRLALQLSGISIPSEMIVCHKCDNPGCVNPEHLFLGTSKENTRDMLTKGRYVAPKGDKSYNHKLNAVDVTQIRIDYFSGKKRQVELAEEYFVTQVCISNIVNYKTWRHLKKISSESLYLELNGVPT